MDTVLVALRMMADLLAGGDPTVPDGYPELWPMARMLAAVNDYLWAVRADGDWMNDWLTHLPQVLRLPVQVMGYLLARYLGN